MCHFGESQAVSSPPDGRLKVIGILSKLMTKTAVALPARGACTHQHKMLFRSSFSAE